MYIQIIFRFKLALYSSALVMKLFNSSKNMFKVEIITMKLKTNLILNASLCICLLTFITEVLHLVVTVG